MLLQWPSFANHLQDDAMGPIPNKSFGRLEAAVIRETTAAVFGNSGNSWNWQPGASTASDMIRVGLLRLLDLFFNP